MKKKREKVGNMKAILIAYQKFTGLYVCMYVHYAVIIYVKHKLDFRLSRVK